MVCAFCSLLGLQGFAIVWRTSTRSSCLTARLLQQGYRYHKHRKTFSGFYRSHYELISFFAVGLGMLYREGLSEPEFYVDLVCKFGELACDFFSFQFGEIITRCGRVGCGLGVVQRSACLVFCPVLVGGCAAFFGCAPVGRASGSMMAPTWDYSF